MWLREYVYMYVVSGFVYICLFNKSLLSVCLLCQTCSRNRGFRSEQRRQKSLFSRHLHPSGVCVCAAEKDSRGWQRFGDWRVAILNRQSGKSSLRRWQLSDLKEVREWAFLTSAGEYFKGWGNVTVWIAQIYLFFLTLASRAISCLLESLCRTNTGWWVWSPLKRNSSIERNLSLGPLSHGFL